MLQNEGQSEEINGHTKAYGKCTTVAHTELKTRGEFRGFALITTPKISRGT